MTDIDKMTDAELGEAIMREVRSVPFGDATSVMATVALLDWLTEHTHDVSITREKIGVYRGVYFVIVIVDRGAIYTQADTLPRAVAEAALRVARELTSSPP